MAKGIVYILTNPSFKEDELKIGKTTRQVEERIKELSKPSGVPNPFRLAHYQEFDDCDVVEKLMHDFFKEKRINNDREFFKVNLWEVIAKLDELKINEFRGKLHKLTEQNELVHKLLADQEQNKKHIKHLKDLVENLKTCIESVGRGYFTLHFWCDMPDEMRNAVWVKNKNTIEDFISNLDKEDLYKLFYELLSNETYNEHLSYLQSKKFDDFSFDDFVENLEEILSQLSDEFTEWNERIFESQSNMPNDQEILEMISLKCLNLHNLNNKENLKYLLNFPLLTKLQFKGYHSKDFDEITNIIEFIKSHIHSMKSVLFVLSDVFITERDLEFTKEVINSNLKFAEISVLQNQQLNLFSIAKELVVIFQINNF